MKSVFCFFCLLTANAAIAQANYATPFTFVTIAGSLTNSGSADGTNDNARFSAPLGIATDNSGNLFVSDYANDTIRKISQVGTNWVVTTIAGLAGNQGGVDGTNGNARFYSPRGLTVDPQGNIYVADSYNYSIRMITPVGTNWVVSTIAGQNRSYGYADGTNSVARFAFPYGVTLDKAGNLYVADRSNDAIRKITPVGTNWVVTTIAGLAGSLGFADGTNSNARFDVPSAIAIGSSNLYVTDLYNFTVRKLTPQGTNWVVTTIAGSIGNGGSVDGTNNAAEFYYPQGIAVDTNENVYIADTENSTIRKLTQIGTNWVVTTLAGVAGTIGGADGAGNQASFHYTADVAVDFGGNLYVSDNNNEIIRMGWPSPIPNPTIAFTLSNSVGLFWADNGHAYTLQTNGDLTTTNWADCEAALNLTNGTNQATIPITAGNIFFRLKN